MIESLPVVFQRPGEFPIARDNQIGTLQRLGLQFVITFDLSFNAVPGSGYHTFLQFTIGGNCCDYGDRIPGLWYYNSKQFMLTSAISGNGDKYKHIAYTVNANTWYRMEISQSLKDNGEVSKCLRIIKYIFILDCV